MSITGKYTSRTGIYVKDRIIFMFYEVKGRGV
jgi:hypothetical protein